jgi:hypothetical protein
MAEYKIGMEIEIHGKRSVVTRIVESTSLFEDTDKKECYTLDEYYLELLSEEGEIGFISLREAKTPFTPPEGRKILYPMPLPWRTPVESK